MTRLRKQPTHGRMARMTDHLEKIKALVECCKRHNQPHVNCFPLGFILEVKTLEALVKEVERLRHRLEIDRAYKMVDGEMQQVSVTLDDDMDGIACRDETIRGLEKQVEELRKAQEWQPAYVEKPVNIHSNPDAKAWARYFTDTFPQHKHMEDVMHAWFANAMMAMHDFMEQQPPKGKDDE